MMTRHPAPTLLIALVTTAACLADSGTRGSSARGSSSPGTGSQGGMDLATTVWSYEGELTRGEAAEGEEPTMSGKFRLKDDFVFAVAAATPGEGESAPDEGSGTSTEGSGAKPKAGPTEQEGFSIGKLQPPARGFSIGVRKSPARGNAKDDKQRPEGAIGKYRVSKAGKLTLILDAEGGLTGAMVLTRDKRDENAWSGTFREKEGRKTVRTWKVAITTTSTN